MPSTGIGVYPGSASAVENDEVSSTYEGRHLTFLPADITGHEHAVVTKGHPVVVGEHIVGVAFKTEVAATDRIAIDTEGIWNLMVYATDEDGNNAVVAGDELYISKLTALISKNRNTVTHTRFGYALGGVTVGANFVIAVKVHWCSDDEEELVGQDGAAFVGADANQIFREYHYEAQGGTTMVGDSLTLTVGTVKGYFAAALFRKLAWTADDNWVTGYAAVAEFELNVGAGAGTMDTMTIIQLNNIQGVWASTGHNNIEFSWLRFQDYATTINEQINIFVNIIDSIANYPAANNNSELFVATSGDKVPTHGLRIFVNGVAYWILCCTTN